MKIVRSDLNKPTRIALGAVLGVITGLILGMLVFGFPGEANGAPARATTQQAVPCEFTNCNQPRYHVRKFKAGAYSVRRNIDLPRIAKRKIKPVARAAWYRHKGQATAGRFDRDAWRKTVLGIERRANCNVVKRRIGDRRTCIRGLRRLEDPSAWQRSDAAKRVVYCGAGAAITLFGVLVIPGASGAAAAYAAGTGGAYCYWGMLVD